MTKKFTVFVYGSLKHGFGNHGFLEDQKYLGPAKTSKNNYLMISLGGFPAVCESENRFFVSGELYEIDKPTLDALDRLEGNGNFYHRVERDFTLGDKTIKAWIYLMPLNLAQLYYTRAGNKKTERVHLDDNSLVWLI